MKNIKRLHCLKIYFGKQRYDNHFYFPDPDVKHKPNPDGILLNGNSNSAPTIYDHGKRKIEVRKHGIILPPSHLLKGFQSLKTSVQVVFCQLKIFCHQLFQIMMIDFVAFKNIYTNYSEIQTASMAILQVLDFRTVCIHKFL